MILTHDNIDKVASFINSSHYKRDEILVTFYNVPLSKFDYASTKAIHTNLKNDEFFNDVAIKIGSFVFVK